MKKYVNVFDYAKEIMQALPKGVLLTTKADGKVNTMTIGWGTLGIEWATGIYHFCAGTPLHPQSARYKRRIYGKYSAR